MQFRHGNLSVNDGFLCSNFQKVIQVLFYFEMSFGCGYVKIGLISEFLDMNQEMDLIELVNKVVDITTSHSF